MTVLAGDSIWGVMERAEDPLVIAPLLDRAQVREGSIDLRLGNEFIVLQRSTVHHIDPTSTDETEWHRIRYRSQERVRISLFNQFVLHPGQLVLGATLEYVSIPTTLSAVIEGRSSWGRLGLIIATANTIGPGFKGCITLELVNSGDVPLVVYPGLAIAQLVLQRTEGVGEYRGSYDCPTGPEFTGFNRDRRVSAWGGKR